MVKIKDIFGSIIIFLIFAMPMILISDMCVVNIKNYDYININETVNATYSNDDISNLTKSRNTYYRHKYYFYDENGNTVSIELYGPKQKYYGRTQHEYKYVIDDTLGDTVTVKDVTIIEKKNLNKLNKLNRKLIFKKSRSRNYYIVTGSKENIERILLSIEGN